ncbi:MAG: sensor histidine kinase N-terminal domain-containing protein, partial [Acinetobacter sp.]
MPNLIRSYSLTRRLSLILLAITTSVWVGSLGCIYWGMQRAANNIFDKSLAETAHALLSTTSSTLEGRVPDHTVIEKAQGEHYNQIIFQIWHKNGKLIYRSVGVDTHPFVQQVNFGWIRIHNKTYRSYSVWDNTNTIQVQIAQVWTIRQDIQRDMLLFLIVVSAFFFPLLSWLILRTIRSHLSAVFSISQTLEKQSIEHLKPINPIVPKEIEPLVNSLNTLLSEIAESMQREKRFTSNAAHELRTPLAAIRMHAQVLLSARSTEEARESAQDIMI